MSTRSPTPGTHQTGARLALTPGTRPPTPASFEAHHQGFLESLRVRSYSPKTLASYSGGLQTFFRFLSAQGVDDLRAVERATVAAYLRWLGEGSFTPWTVYARLQAVRRFFEYLERTDAVLLDPCLGLQAPKLADRLPRTVLTVAQARAVLDAPDTQTKKGIRDKAILELFYSTGIRLEEMTRLTIHDVDTRGGFLRVHKGKFAKDRVVPMGNTACRYVREYLAEVRAVWSKGSSHRSHRRDERALWLSHRQPHGPIKAQSIQVMVRGYGKAAGRTGGIEGSVSPHVWRHTCATHLVAAGANIAYVQRLLGHRSLETTQIYTRVALAEVKRTHRKAHPRQRVNPPKVKAPSKKRSRA